MLVWGYRLGFQVGLNVCYEAWYVSFWKHLAVFYISCVRSKQKWRRQTDSLLEESYSHLMGKIHSFVPYLVSILLLAMKIRIWTSLWLPGTKSHSGKCGRVQQRATLILSLIESLVSLVIYPTYQWIQDQHETRSPGPQKHHFYLHCYCSGIDRCPSSIAPGWQWQ